MIDIKIRLNNVSSDVNLNSLVQDLRSIITQVTGESPNVNVNVQDNNSTSPLGLHLTKDYLRLRNRI